MRGADPSYKHSTITWLEIIHKLRGSLYNYKIASDVLCSLRHSSIFHSSTASVDTEQRRAELVAIGDSENDNRVTAS